MLFGKVFSMQYLVWLCPLLPLITGRWRVPLYATFLEAGAFSQVLYPYFYVQFELFYPPMVIMMAARNIQLIICAVFVLMSGHRWPKESEFALRT